MGAHSLQERNEPPSSGRHVLLYDGSCRFCIAGSDRLVRLARRGSIERVSYHDTGVMDQFPGIPPEGMERGMRLVTPDGRMYVGAEAAARALATRPILGKLAMVYYAPGVRWLADRAYAFIARRRHSLMGRAGSAAACGNASCAVSPAPGRR